MRFCILERVPVLIVWFEVLPNEDNRLQRRQQQFLVKNVERQIHIAFVKGLDGDRLRIGLQLSAGEKCSSVYRSLYSRLSPSSQTDAPTNSRRGWAPAKATTRT